MRSSLVLAGLLPLAGLLLTPHALHAQTQDPAAADDELTPPKLTRFVEAPYPAAEQERGTEAKVVLRLHIDVEGSVVEASVDSGASEAFNAAAVTAAKQFVFEPARKGGEAVAAIILYEYRFKLERRPKPKDPKAAKAVRTGSMAVALRVDGAPVVGAQVELSSAAGSAGVQTSDAEGRVTFSGLKPGQYRVNVSAPGFEPYSHVEEAKAGAASEVRYGLVPKSEAGDVVVRGEVARDVTVRKISFEEFEVVPGAAGDPIRVIESLPGVARSSGGELVIRGASPFFSGVMVDGMEVPFLYHLFELASVVPPEMVDDVTLYPSNFGPRYGRFVGGIVDVGLGAPDVSCTEDYGKPSTRTGCYHGVLQLDFIGGRAMVEGPIPGAKHWSFALSARRSWIDYLLKAVTENITDLQLDTAPRYYDGYMLAQYQKGKDKLSLRAYASQDELAIIIGEQIADDVTQVGRFEFEFGFERLQAVYESQLSHQVQVRSMLGLGRDHISFYTQDLVFEQRRYPLAFRHEFLTQPHDRVGVNVGVDMLVSPYDLRVRFPERDTATPVEEQTLHDTDATFAAFMTVPLQPTDRLSVVPGVRAEHTPLFEESTLSPRVLATYDLVQRPEEKWLRRTTLKVGAGRYYQAPPSLIKVADDEANTTSIRAGQYSVGVEQEIFKRLDVSVEAFQIDRDQIFSSRERSDGTTDVGNEGTSQTRGLEVFLRYHSDPRFFGWIAYTLAKSVAQDRPDELEYRPDFDQTHNLIILGSYDLGSGWRLGGRFRYVTGNPFTDVAQAPSAQSLFDGQTGDYIAQFTQPNAQRFPAVHALDIRVDRTWTYRKWALTWYLDLRNAYNHRVVDSKSYNYDFSRSEDSQGLPLLPNMGLKGEF